MIGSWLKARAGAFVFVLLICALFGCAATKEAAKCVLGVSTKELEDSRENAIKEKLNCAYSECYKDILEGLKSRGTYVYAQDTKNKMIAVYVSEEDTTPVGVFFKVVDDKTTQIEVSSPSVYGKEFIANRIKSIFSPGEKKGSSDAKENANQ